jgi:hypothetical protein
MKRRNLKQLEENLKLFNLLLEWTNECIESVNEDMNKNVIKVLNDKDENNDFTSI